MTNMSECKKIELSVSLPQSIDHALENLTDKPTKAMGTTLADCWNLIFGPFSYLAEKQKIKFQHKIELFHQQLTEADSKIPDSKRIEPSLQVTAQALENSKYCIEKDELRNMFVSLISNSLNSDYQNSIHPSFAEILKQMSVLDAQIMKLYKQDKAFIGLPVCQYIPKFPGFTPSTPAPEHIFLELPGNDIFCCSLSISSLERLGLVVASYNHILSTPHVYDKFSQHPFYKAAAKSVPTMNMNIKKGVVSPTSLGRSFIKVCIPD